MLMGKMLSLRRNLLTKYPEGPLRQEVPFERIFWELEYSEYSPSEFTSASILESENDHGFVDDVIGGPKTLFKWNKIDGNFSRVSHEGKYLTNMNGYPLNPIGRTGIYGRGGLPRWAVNHTVTCLITRIKSNEPITTDSASNPSIQYEFLATQKFGSQWAMPSALVRPDEKMYGTFKRGIMEEIFSINKLNDEEAFELYENLTNMFHDPDIQVVILYKGYVDDPRNTDNAWVETICIHVALSKELDAFFRAVKLNPANNSKAMWMDVTDDSLELHAGQDMFLKELLKSIRD